MRILVITQWFDPEPVEPSSEVMKTLAGYGHDVEVVTGIPHWPGGKFYSGYRPRLCQSETISGVPVIRLPLYPSHDRSSLKRILTLLTFALSLVLVPWVAKKPQVVYAIQPPTVWLPAWLLAKLWRVPLVLEIQDLWPDNLRATGFVRGEKLLRQVEAYCNWFCRRAAAIRVISPGFKSALIGRGVKSSRIHVLPNPVDVSLYKPTAGRHPIADKLDRKKFTVMYAGAMGAAQGLGTVMQAAKMLNGDLDVQFAMVGDGSELDLMRDQCRRFGLTNVHFLGRFRPEEMPDILALSDILLVHLKDDPLFRITVPHKILSYLAVGKPVLAAVEGDAAEVVLDARAGLACPPGNACMLASRVKEFVQMPSEERAIMGANARQAACSKYRKERVIGDLASVLEHCGETGI